MKQAQVFANKGCMVIKNLVNVDRLYAYAVQVAKGKPGDNQSPNSPSIYGDPKMNELQKKLLPKLEEITGLKLFKTYTYFRVYQPNTILRVHRDRPACEISISLCLGFDSKRNWPLYCLDYEENVVKVILQAGDALIYRGCDLWHWRPKFTGKQHTQVFLHYVDQNGSHVDQKDDLGTQR